MPKLSYKHHEPVFGIVGILDPGKGQDMAIEYFNKLLEYYPNARLNIFGDKKGPFKNMIMRLVDKLGLKEKVHFKGFVESQEDIYGAINILLMFQDLPKERIIIQL